MMKTYKDKIIKTVIDEFQSHKGKMSFYCFDKDFIPEIIYNIIVPFHIKNPLHQIFIVVDCYDTRINIINYINSKPPINAGPKLNVTVITKDYIKSSYHYSYKLSILVGVNEDFDVISHISKESNFTLCILTKNIMNTEFINSVRNILPSINIEDTVAETNKARIYSPVEEHRVRVELSDIDKEHYNKYTDYINSTVSILGSLDNIDKCKNGDKELNISSSNFCNIIAKENGWNEHIDVNIPFMKQIDDNYNPNVIFERACTFYTIAKNRRDLVTDNESKLKAIKDICNDNADKQIIIVSKRGEFAAKITEYLNENNIPAGDYHDCLDTINATDEYGNLIVYKSGIKKGQPKKFGWQAQNSLNETRFNNKLIKVLSIKSASNIKLKTACDILIFTSPLCDNIISFKTRFTNITFNTIPTITYKLYCIGTIENDKLNKDKPNNIIKVVDDNMDNFIGYDENSGDIII